MSAYYNENDPFKAAVLREAIKARAIAQGDVDERSIADVRPDDLRGYTQCHFFAGGDSGASRCGKQGGLTSVQSGLEAARARVSARQAKDSGLQTLVISGRIGSGSYASVALEQSLASRLQQRLDMAGSTLFKMIWRRRLTPLGRPYLERAAQSLRAACGSVFARHPKMFDLPQPLC